MRTAWMRGGGAAWGWGCWAANPKNASAMRTAGMFALLHRHVGRGSVDGGERDVAQPQVDRELPAVVDEVAEQGAAHERLARAVEEDLAARLEHREVLP